MCKAPRMAGSNLGDDHKTFYRRPLLKQMEQKILVNLKVKK
jgi:hypothetical protein